MSELSDHLKRLRGELTQLQFARRCGVSVRTIAGAETLRESIKLSTVRKIATACNLIDDEYLALIIAWIRTELGDRDFRRLSIKTSLDPSGKWVLNERHREDVLRLFQLLNTPDQEQIIKAMQRPDVLRCLPAINHVWDKLDEEQSSRQLQPSNPINLS